MTLDVVIGLSGPVLTAVVAIWWANYVLGDAAPTAGGIEDGRRGDIRTW